MQTPKTDLRILRLERSRIVARLVQAQRIHDDIREHRIRVCQRELEALNARIRCTVGV